MNNDLLLTKKVLLSTTRSYFMVTESDNKSK